ncbi:27_t:CDS:2 [Diversispora eburnea]|uniref:Protein YIP n=1 Tax=Diversispora eburnea TaxID=1213867 RepID=A0A9N8W4T8_9GLOM|nr:27_t:CDS:2 [Diversispora eburnea]
MTRDEYSVVVEMDDDTPVLREELEFQDFSSGSGVGGKIAQDKQQTSNNNSVIFLLFVTSSIAETIASLIDKKGEQQFDFAILSFAVGAIYSYAFGIPLLVWITLKYFGCKPSLMGILGLYGYGLTVWIPISVICIVPNEIIRWTLVIAGFAISGFFKTKNLYPVISAAEAKTSRLILIFILGAHAAFALLLKFEFFSYTTHNN